MEKAIKWVTKVGDYKFMSALYNYGEVYCQTIPFFRKMDSNQERFDTYENASYIDQIVEVMLQDPISGKMTRLSKNAGADLHLANANLITHNNLTTGNIFSCSGFIEDESNKIVKLNPNFRAFGNTIMLIDKPNEFFNRIENELKRQNLKYQLGLVYYYDTDEAVGNLSIYHKKLEHSYQNEIRLWIDNPKDEPLTLKIGSLKDISCLFLVDEILKLQPDN